MYRLFGKDFGDVAIDLILKIAAWQQVARGNFRLFPAANIRRGVQRRDSQFSTPVQANNHQSNGAAGHESVEKA